VQYVARLSSVGTFGIWLIHTINWGILPCATQCLET
jgi:hypothetical protein